MNAKRLTLVFAAAVATLGWSAGLALGYCVYTPTNRANHDPGPIPVYLVAAGLIDIRGVGIGEDVISIRLLTITRYVEAAIDIINSSSAAAPPLYLAGYRSLNYNSPWPEFPPGITVSTYGNCNIQPTMGEFARHTFFENKSWIRMIRGGGSACDEFADPDYHWWVDPADDDGAAGTVLDFVGVLVHEFLHSLGLGHPDDSEMNLCEPGSYTETDAAVMATGNKDYRRRLRRDDIEGLRELYGAPERSLYYSESETSPDPPGALDWPGPIVVDPSIRTNTPVAASDAGHFALENTFVGFTNEDDEVRFFSGPWFGWSGNAANGGDAILDSNNAPVRSWDSVEASLGSFVDGSERRLVAWISGPEESCCSGESEMGQDVRIWWRIFSNGSWKAPQSTGLTKYKTFGASYDRREDVFVLAYIDSWPVEGDLPENQRIFVRTINSWSGGGGCTQALTTVEHVLAVGGVACDDRMGTLPTGATRCAIAVSTTDDALADEEAGPRLRFIEGEITEHDGFICFVRDDWEDDPTVVPLTTELTSLGNVDVAMDGHTPNGALLGSYVPAVPEPFDGDSEPSPERNIFTMTRDLEGKLTGPVANQRSFNSDFWPLTLSTQTRTTGPSHTRWRVFMYGSDGGAGVGGMLVAAIALAVLLVTIALLIYKRRFFRL